MKSTRSSGIVVLVVREYQVRSYLRAGRSQYNHPDVQWDGRSGDTHVRPGLASSNRPFRGRTGGLGYYRIVPGRHRRARVEDIHAAASAMPHVSVVAGPAGNAVYQVGGKSFVFFRTPRPDALDPASGDRLDDVIVLWVASEDDKQALVQDPASPWFTTAHFDGHPSVLVRASRLGELEQEELVEMVQEAWVARASPRRAAAWLRSAGLT